MVQISMNQIGTRLIYCHGDTLKCIIKTQHVIITFSGSGLKT